MKTLLKHKIFFSLTVIIILSGCAASKVSKVNYAGKYNYTITTPMGEQAGYIILSRDGKIYTGQIGSDQGSTELSNLKIEGNKLSANFSFMGYDISVKGDIGDKVIEGTFTAEGYDIPFKALKE